MRLKQLIPNIVTSINLFCGLIALIFISTGEVYFASVMIFGSLVADFLDGFVARMLGVSSPIGKELDSLADMVSFGVVPGFIMCAMLQEVQGLDFIPEMIWYPPSGRFPWILLGFLIPILSAWRLAKFNLDERQGDEFYGLNTPANTILILSLWQVIKWNPEGWMAQGINQVWVLALITLLSCFMLVADIRMLAFKFKNFSLQDNWIRYVFIAIVLVSLAVFRYKAIPFLILAYVLISLLQNLIQSKTS